MLKKLNYQVIETPVFYGQKRLENKKALVREDTGAFLGIVGRNYKILQNEDIIPATAEKIASLIPSGFTTKEVVQERGAHAFYAMEFDYGEKISLGRSKLSVLIWNSFARRAVKIIAGVIDSYCDNGSVIGEYDAQVLRHTKNLNSKFKNSMTSLIDAYLKRIKKYQEWTERSITSSDAHGFIFYLQKEGYYSKKRADAIYEQYCKEVLLRGENMYALFSAFTYYSSHLDADRGFGTQNANDDRLLLTQLNRQMIVVKIENQLNKAF